MTKDFSTALNSADQALFDLFHQETEIQAALRRTTLEKVEHHQMMTTPEQMQLLTLLIHSMKARRAIEVGVFTGYGSLAIALALPDDGELIACDNSEGWPSIGKPFWEQAGVANKISLQIAPAAETLQALLDEGQASSFDFIFVDADKINYPQYAELGHDLLRPNGLMIFDNVLRVGEELVVEKKIPATKAVSELLESISKDPRFETSLIPLVQGMLLARKRGYNDSSPIRD